MLLKMLLQREARIREDTLRGVASGAAGEGGGRGGVCDSVRAHLECVVVTVLGQVGHPHSLDGLNPHRES